MRPRNGHSLLEGALTLLVFTATLLGIMDISQMLFFRNAFYERARAGARYAAACPDQLDAARNVAVFGTPSAPQQARGIMGLTPSMVSVERSAPGTLEDRVTVTIRDYPFYSFSPLLAGRVSSGPIRVTLITESM